MGQGLLRWSLKPNITTVARLLAYVTGLVNQELLLKNEYLLAENCILKAHLRPGFRLSPPERTTLAEIGKRLGRKLLRQVAHIADGGYATQSSRMVKILECAEGLRFSMMEIEDKRNHLGAALGLDSVGINRRGVVNERVIQERNSETILTPSHVRAAGNPALEASDRGTCRLGIPKL